MCGFSDWSQLCLRNGGVGLMRMWRPLPVRVVVGWVFLQISSVLMPSRVFCRPFVFQMSRMG